MDTLTAELIAEPSIKTADGWLVTIAKRRSLRGNWMYDAAYFDEWHQAERFYEDPGHGWQSTAIHACKDGEPFAKLSAYKVAQLCKESA